jgi:uncharacterized membrane protein (UPF0127 family)
MQELKTKYIKFNEKRILVYVVESLIDKMKGATIFKEPPKNIDGVLFVGYDAIAKDIWMKGMKFPLNIYFLDENMNVIKSYENVQPCNKFLGFGCPKYKCDSKYSYVLELWR